MSSHSFSVLHVTLVLWVITFESVRFVVRHLVIHCFACGPAALVLLLTWAGATFWSEPHNPVLGGRNLPPPAWRRGSTGVHHQTWRGNCMQGFSLCNIWSGCSHIHKCVFTELEAVQQRAAVTVQNKSTCVFVAFWRSEYISIRSCISLTAGGTPLSTWIPVFSSPPSLAELHLFTRIDGIVF